MAVTNRGAWTDSTRRRIRESKLTKGQRRKLNALRKSVGDEIADKAFVEWLRMHVGTGHDQSASENMNRIAQTLWPMVQKQEIRIGRKGYFVKRGRGRLIVQPANA